MKPLINILIRTHDRPAAFKRCLKSIVDQNYPNIRVIVAYDSRNDYIPRQLEQIRVIPDVSLPYPYDRYCNTLKWMVDDGWFFFLDDDDVLMPNVLNEIELTELALLVQLKRKDFVCPQSLDFKRGLIGMPCLILHHSLKHLADIPGTGQGDYFWIKEVISKIQVKFIEKVLVYSPSRGLGKSEIISNI